MRGRVWVAVGALVILLTGCGDGVAGGGSEVSGPWRTSSDPVETGGLVWAAASSVHLSDGTTIDTGGFVRTFVVAGDGVYYFRAATEEEVASVSDAHEELLYADGERSGSGTGIHLSVDSLRASPDGRYVAGLDTQSGEKDGYGTPQAAVVVLDLATGEVVRSTEGFGDPDRDDLAVDYENAELEVYTLTNDTLYVRGVRGDYAYDPGTGEGTRLAEGEEPPRPGDDELVSPDGAWRIRASNAGRDQLVSSSGEKVIPKAGSSRWDLDWWADDDTVVGNTVSGPGRGEKLGPRDIMALMACVVPSGACEVYEETVGQVVVYPIGTKDYYGTYLQDSTEEAP
ncbi:MAG: hypothetical protein H0X12_07755 [Nocardioides sp.]|nr:hypothetical protein [Nocardioides sp.]